ncbi:hypothetical protein J1N35_026508 [Gossypium stocksii]|uniref:RNase H type-1 domain-containing protein n=1 Tax=Gossypium stocksii TaxID=47602 RepID=A0A9D3V8S1_9ROSI|nr:hypothetical protein J1N35_026508 [Gossypium stocksii]
MVSQISLCFFELNEIDERLLLSKVGYDGWRLPKAPFLKINFDAALKAQFTKSYLILVIRDDRSRIIGKRVILNEYVPSIFAVEALVYLQALKLGEEIRQRDVIIEGDSLTILRKRKFREVRFTFVSRSTNRSAHALAQKGWIRGESLNLGWQDLVAIVTLKARDNLVRGVEGEDGVARLLFWNGFLRLVRRKWKIA